MLCTIDQEVFCEPCQPIAALGDPAADLVGPAYALDALNYAAQHVQAFCQGYRLRPQEMGNNCGAVAGTSGVNLRNGNLVVSFCLPGSGPADPPIRFFYNSQSIDDSEYGFGWTGLYRQWIEMAGSSSSSSADRTWLTSLYNPAGKAWRIERDPADGRVVSITDPFKKKTQFDYNASDRLTKVTDSGGRATTFVINNDGQLEKITSPANGVTLLSYDAENLLVGWTNQAGHKTAFAYDDCMRLKTITTPENETTRYRYIEDDPIQRVVTNALNIPTTITLDDHGNAHVINEPEDITTTYTWDSMQRLDSFVDGRDKTTTFKYDEMDDFSKRIEVIDRPIGALTFTYDTTKSRLTSITDPNGNTTALAWDELETDHYPGVVTTLTNADSKDYVLDYNESGQVKSLTDPLTHTTTWDFDTRGRRLAVTNAESETTTFAYDSKNRVNAVTDPTDETTHLIRDDENRVESVTDPNTNSTWFKYDGNGRLTSTENALYKKWTRKYDKNGRLESESDPLDNTTTYTYDAAGNTTEIKNPKGLVTTNAYDDVNRLESTTNPDLKTSTFTYDKADNQVAITNALGKKWTYTYDSNNRLETRKDPLLHLSTFTYDDVGNQTSITNPLSETTTTVYDDLNRVEAVIDALDHRTTYAYDDANRLESVKDAEDNVTTYLYDDASRLEVSVDPKLNRTTYTYDAAGRRRTVTNGDGKTATMSYDAAGRHVSTEDAGGNITTQVYDKADQIIQTISPLTFSSYKSYYDNGQLETETNEENEVTTYTYDPNSQIETVYKPLDRITTYVYDDVGRLSATQAPLGIITTNIYDAADRRINLVNGIGVTTVFDYDDANRLTQVTTPESRVTTFGYDDADRPTGTTDPRTHKTTITYYANGGVKEQVDARGKITTYTYDNTGRLESVKDPLSRVWTTVYDAAGNIEVEITPLSFRTTYTYDGANRLKTTLDAENRTTTRTYHDTGLLHEVIQPEGYITTNIYDANSRIQSVATTGNAGTPEITTYQYDMAGRVETITNPRNYQTSFVYDSSGRQVEQRQQIGTGSQVAVYTSVYDQADRIVAQVSPTGSRTTYVYDAASRLLELVDGTGYTTIYDYDDDNNQTSKTTPLGYITTYTYDGNGNLETQLIRASLKYGESPTNCVTTFVYDENNRQTEIVDALNNTSTNVYDDAGRLTEVIDANNHSAVFTLDNDDRMTVLTDAESQKTTYTYDDVGNQKTIHKPTGEYVQQDFTGLDQPEYISTRNGPGGALLSEQDISYYPSNRRKSDEFTDDASNSETTTYTYDAVGNTTSIENAAGTVTLSYDAANRQDEQQAGGQTTGTEHFDDGRVKKVTYKQGTPSASSTAYTYDDAGREKTVTRDGKTTTFVYDQDGNRTKRELPNGSPTGIVFSMSYNQAGWELRRQEIATGPSVLTDDFFEYNKVGMRLTDPGSIGTLTYDATYQVLTQTRELESSDPLGWCELTVDQWDTLTPDQWAEMVLCNPAYSYDITYDNVGNPLVEITDAGTITSTYDTNRVTSRNLNGELTTYTYDDLGRRKTMIEPDPDNPGQTVTTTYGWSPSGRLASIDLPGGGTVTYTYDGSDLLTQRQSPSQTRKYIWTGNALTAEQDGSGDTVIEYERSASGYGPLNASHDVSGTSDQASYQAFDLAGNVKRVYDDDENITEQQVSTAFGELKAVQIPAGTSTNSGADPSLSFVAELGGMRDPDTGLVYLRSRWYDTLTKQFLSPDPLGVEQSDVNPYRYGGNNPVANSDPSGLDFITTKRGVVNWVIEDGGFWKRNVKQLPIGTRDGELIRLSGSYNGGVVGYDELRKQVEAATSRRDISQFNLKSQHRIILATINDVRRGLEYKAEPDSVLDVVEAANRGIGAGVLQIADTFTPNWQWMGGDLIAQANANAWDDIGLAGTWYQSASAGAALIAREALITAATLGTGSAIQAGRASLTAGRAATTAARLGGTGSKVGRFFNTARSPMVQGAAKAISGSNTALRATQATNFGLRGFEAYTTGRDSYEGYQMLSAGNPWGWLNIAGAGLGSIGAVGGGFGALRRIGRVGKDAISPGLLSKATYKGNSYGLIGIVKASKKFDESLRSAYIKIAQSEEFARDLAKYNQFASRHGLKRAASVEEIIEALQSKTTFARSSNVRAGVFTGSKHRATTPYLIQGNLTAKYGARAGRHELTHLGAALKGQGDTVLHEIGVQIATTPEQLIIAGAILASGVVAGGVGLAYTL